MSVLQDKWNADKPSIEPPTKERIFALIKQASWDARLKRYIPKIVEKYNAAHPDDIIVYRVNE